MAISDSPALWIDRRCHSSFLNLINLEKKIAIKRLSRSSFSDSETYSFSYALYYLLYWLQIKSGFN